MLREGRMGRKGKVFAAVAGAALVAGIAVTAAFGAQHATPDITVDPETYRVEADGEWLTCEPADVLPMAQRYFLF